MLDDDRFSNEDEDRGRGPRRPMRRGGGGRRRRVCPFCADKVQNVDYKDADNLRRFVNEEGKIRPRRQTNVCAQHQRSLARAVKRARHLALLPYTGQHAQD
jgi:small subunit ribosomal protein S18